MSEIMTYEEGATALQYQPYREGFQYVLYEHPSSGEFQWTNNPRFAEMFGMVRIFPDLPATFGFGISPFGTTPFGS